MKIHDVLAVYDSSYAREYDALYIANPAMLPSVIYQSSLLKKLLSGARSWLDLACGTGFYLSMFDNVPVRCGLDISPEMLRVARARNPNLAFVERSFLERNPEWNASWDVLSCMWWAYCLVESIHEIELLVRNIAEWVTPEGLAFVPLCNPLRFGLEKPAFPAEDAAWPGVQFTGVLWSWREPSGKVHEHMVTPFPQTMVELFARYFEDVDIVSAPLDEVPAGYWSGDFLIARSKRRSIVEYSRDSSL